MNWVEVAVKLVAENSGNVKFAPLKNIAGADIKFDKRGDRCKTFYGQSLRSRLLFERRL